MDKRPLKVFLCHASADKPKVRELYRTLKRRGVQPWLDAEDLIPGQNWEVEIPKALLSSDAIIICLTPNSVDKEGYVQKEIKFALDKAMEMSEGRIFIIPARLEDCELPFSLKKYHAVNLYEKDGYTKLMQALKLRASQLERATVELPKKGETTAEIKKVVEEKKPSEPKEERLEIKTPKSSQDKVDIGGDVKESVIVSGSGNVINIGGQKKPEPKSKFSFKEVLLKSGELFGTLKRVNLKTLLLGLLMLLAILGLYFFTTRPSQQEYPINLYVEMGRITIYSDSDLKSPITTLPPSDTIYFLCRQDIAHGSYQVAKSQDDCGVNKSMGWVREKVVKRLFAGDFPVTEQVVVKTPTAKATEIIAPTPTIALVVVYPIQLFSNSERVALYVDVDLKTPRNRFLIPDRTVYYLCIENTDFSSSLIALSQENCITKNTLGWVKSASVIKLFHEDFPNRQP